jgi:hypothetical protein
MSLRLKSSVIWVGGSSREFPTLVGLRIVQMTRVHWRLELARISLAMSKQGQTESIIRLIKGMYFVRMVM